MALGDPFLSMYHAALFPVWFLKSMERIGTGSPTRVST
jgi:hypothetical protein